MQIEIAPRCRLGYFQRKGYNLPLWREIAVGSQSRLLSVELKHAPSPTRTPGSVMTRTDSKHSRLERIAASPRWDGTRFRNSSPVSRGDPTVAMPSMSEFICGGDRRVPQAPLPSRNPLDIWTRPVDSGLRATWLGHSTVLIEIDGWRVLTDPVWGPRASPSRFIGPKRFQPVPVALRELPPLDAVIVSHDHYDHLDYTTMRLMRKSLGTHHHFAGRRRAPRGFRHCPGTDSRARLVGITSRAGHRPHAACRTVTSFLRTRPERRQQDVVVLVRDPVATSSRVLQRRYRPDGRTRRDPRPARALRSRHARSGRMASGVGQHSPRTGQRARGAHFIRRRPAPARALGHVQSCAAPMGRTRRNAVQLAPKTSARLILPQLGEPVEPAHDFAMTPWWRGVDVNARKPRRDGGTRMPKAMPFPPD